MKIPRKGLVLFLLIIGLVVIGSTRTDRVQAKTCSEAMYDYYMADVTYDSARILLFYNSPTSCLDQCEQWQQGSPGHDQCMEDCRISRQTALAEADVALFAAAGETCTPEEPDAAAQAQSMFDTCVSTYDYLDYPVDSDERWAVFDQFSACREASHIDEFQ